VSLRNQYCAYAMWPPQCSCKRSPDSPKRKAKGRGSWPKFVLQKVRHKAQKNLIEGGTKKQKNWEAVSLVGKQSFQHRKSPVKCNFPPLFSLYLLSFRTARVAHKC